MKIPGGASGGWQAAARLLGLGVRSRGVVIGVEGVRRAAVRGKLALALLAADASPNSSRKVSPLLKARRVTLLVGPDSRQLGEAVGRSSVVALGLTSDDLASGIIRALNRGVEPRSGE